MSINTVQPCAELMKQQCRRIARHRQPLLSSVERFRQQTPTQESGRQAMQALAQLRLDVAQISVMFATLSSAWSYAVRPDVSLQALATLKKCVDNAIAASASFVNTGESIGDERTGLILHIHSSLRSVLAAVNVVVTQLEVLSSSPSLPGGRPAWGVGHFQMGGE